MATARTDMAREIYTFVLACLSVLQIEGDVNREVNQSWCESREPMRLNATPAMHCEQSSNHLTLSSQPSSKAGANQLSLCWEDLSPTDSRRSCLISSPSWRTPICNYFKALFRSLPVINQCRMSFENLDPAIVAGKWPACFVICRKAASTRRTYTGESGAGH